MSELDNYRVDKESRRAGQRVNRPTRYSQAVNRYLGVYGDPSRQHPAPTVAATRSHGGVVLVGVDDSPASYVAVDHAAIEAELRGWSLRLVHAGLDDQTGLLERMIGRVHACAPTVPVSSRFDFGLGKASILVTDAAKADLVVVGHRHGVVTTALGLSVGGKVAGLHNGPVLVVRVPGWPPGHDFATQPIMVCREGLLASTQTVAFAFEEARLRGCDLVMMHDHEPAEPLEIRDGVTVHHKAITSDRAASLIEGSQHTAAVVMGRREWGVLTGSGLDSVSRALLRHAHCPLFLVG